MNPIDPGQFVTGVGAGISPDGRISELQFVRTNGKIAYLQFPTEAAASLMLNIEQALGTLFEKQRALLKGEDPRAFFPVGAKQVTKLQGAIAKDGEPVLSLVLKSGLRLDFALDRQAIPDLIAWLGELEAVVQKGPTAPH